MKPRRVKTLLPPWNMPSDPVRAVFWFLHWLLRVLARFFYIPILAGSLYEAYLNGVVGFIFTLLVGLLVWAGIALLLAIFNVSSGVNRFISEVNRVQRGYSPLNKSMPTYEFPTEDDRVVEGTITDLEEERRKRRQE